MPCYDGGPYRESEDALKKLKLVEAMLCAIMTVLENNGGTFENVIDHLDFSKAGVTRQQLIAWWDEHKRKDTRHESPLVRP